MLKITTNTEDGITNIAVEGKLTVPWVKELTQTWQSAAQPMMTVRINLSEITFIDREGKDLLAMMYRSGVELTAAGCMNRCIVEEIIRSEDKTRRDENGKPFVEIQED